MPSLRIVLSVFLVLVAAACVAPRQAAERDDERYPIVTDPPPEYGETVTEPSGALSSRPLKPTEYETEPSQSCERQPYRSASGNGLVVVPPRPGLTAHALSPRRVEVSWRFERMPLDCRPTSLLVSIVANDAVRATPTTVSAPFTGETGRITVEYPEFLPEPDVALASALTLRGQRSRTARVLIRR